MKNRRAIYVSPPKEGAAPGPGDRVLVRLERHGEAYEARIIRRLDRETPTRLIGVLRDSPCRRLAAGTDQQKGAHRIRAR